MSNLEKLVREHVETLNSGVVDDILSHYHQDAIIIHQQGIASGHDELRGLFEFFASGVLIPGKTQFDLQIVTTHENMAYIIWSAESPTFNIPFATDTFVYANDLIVQQTTAGVMDSKS